jgi:hypothetical protein
MECDYLNIGVKYIFGKYDLKVNDFLGIIYRPVFIFKQNISEAGII